jgi:glycerophosphoryl diester phosphodiesterase
MYHFLLFLTLLLISMPFGWGEVYDGPWRQNIVGDNTCWTDVPGCNRVMTVAHGGQWSLPGTPYDSLPAFQRAYENGADAVKGDFRVSSDNKGVVMHSSPVEIFESFNCYGKYVENMTASECEQCRMLHSDYNFITVETLLNWASGLINVMLCVKENKDFPRAISTLIELNATQRAFLEIHINDFLNLESSNVPNWDKVYYVVELGGPGNQYIMISFLISFLIFFSYVV